MRKCNFRSGSTIAERLEYYSMPVPFCGCKIWLGAVNDMGYGKLNFNYEYIYAHRAAWEQENGSIPDGKMLLHSCDTPPCIEVGHLFLGDHDANMADMAAKGRSARGVRNGRSVLTEPQVLAILAASGTHKIIGEEYGVSRTLVSLIKSGQRWGHVVAKERGMKLIDGKVG